MGSHFQPTLKSYLFIVATSLLIAVALFTAPRSSEAQVSYTHHRVVISKFEFKPKNLMLKKGDIVTWINQDIVPHDITLLEDNLRISPTLSQGQKFNYVIEKPFEYLCGIHPMMTGSVKIEK